jgi:hypothetical protein
MTVPVCPLKMDKSKAVQGLTALCDKQCAWLLGNGRCAITQIAIALSEKK